MKSKLIILAAAALAVLILSAGCVSETPVKTTDTKIPVEMHDALYEFSDDLTTVEYSILKDLSSLSEKIVNSDEDEIQLILTEYYSSNPCLTAVIFRNVNDDVYISAPVFVDLDLSEYAVLEEQDFIDAGGFILRDNVFTKYHGYLNLYYKPVYDKDGKYLGYVLFAADEYSLLYLHPLMLGQDKSYTEYICFITNEDDKILYSSIDEAIDYTLTKEGYYDGLAYIPYVKSGDGACKYESEGLYRYEKDITSEKITAWHTTYSSHGQRYTIYLIDAPNEGEIKTEDVFTVDTQQALNDIRGAYIFANTDGKDKLIERLNSGYYKTQLFICDMSGNVVASSDKETVGKNYLNSRGMYGISFVMSALFEAEQGGGNIYYLTPAERVVYPCAAQFTYGIVMQIDSTSYLYCETPGSADAVLNDKSIRPDLTVVSRNVLEDAYVKGVDAVAEIINSNPDKAAEIYANGENTEVVDIAILDVSGNVYASSAFPELVGESATFMTDVYGGSTTRTSDVLAKTGGGYKMQLFKNKDNEGYVDLYAILIEPIDSKYYISTSTFIATFEDVLTPAIENIIPTV